MESQKDALNQQLTDFESEQDEEILNLQASLDAKEQLIADSLEAVKQNSAIIGEEIKNMAEYHGIAISDAIITSWQNGENAIASYGSVLSAGTSAFIGNIMGVENEVYQLQYQANATADSLAWMFATRADNLVGQLTASYTNEQMLNYMTQALRDSLVNTLERGYNISGITSAFNGIASSANQAASAVRDLVSAMNSASNSSLPDTNNSKGYTMDVNPTTGYHEIIDKSTGKVVSTHRTEKAAMNAYAKLPKYASGTRNAKGGISITDEEGFELKLPKLANGNYSLVGEGTQILTADQTEMLRRWSELNPVDVVPTGVRNMVHDIALKQPQVVSRNVNQPVNVHYDSLVTVNGDVNDTKHFLQQMTQTVRNELVDYTNAVDMAIKGYNFPFKYIMKKAPYILDNGDIYMGNRNKR